MYDELKSFSQQLEEEVRVATEDLKRTQEKLIQSEKLAALGKLSAGIAHEIRNPLTSIKILINSLAEKLENGKTKEDIEVIEDEIERMNRIIKSFLDFARPKEPEFSSVNINRILETTVNLVSGELKEHNIVLKKEIFSLPHIQADEEQMRQIFLNLLLNAIEAMPEGGKLRIETELSGE